MQKKMEGDINPPIDVITSCMTMQSLNMRIPIPKIFQKSSNSLII